MWNPFRRRVPPPAPFTGNCLVRCFTGDGNPVGRCYHSTYDGICPTHGDVSQYLEHGDSQYLEHVGWPRDFELPKYDGSPWAETLRQKWQNR